MNTITYSNARQNLSKTMKKVNNDKEPVIVTSQSNGNVVIVAQDEYDSLVETAYLLRSPKNAQKLLQSMKQAKDGQAISQRLLKP